MAWSSACNSTVSEWEVLVTMCQRRKSLEEKGIEVIEANIIKYATASNPPCKPYADTIFKLAEKISNVHTIKNLDKFQRSCNPNAVLGPKFLRAVLDAKLSNHNDEKGFFRVREAFLACSTCAPVVDGYNTLITKNDMIKIAKLNVAEAMEDRFKALSDCLYACVKKRFH